MNNRVSKCLTALYVFVAFANCALINRIEYMVDKYTKKENEAIYKCLTELADLDPDFFPRTDKYVATKLMERFCREHHMLRRIPGLSPRQFFGANTVKGNKSITLRNIKWADSTQCVSRLIFEKGSPMDDMFLVAMPSCGLLIKELVVAELMAYSRMHGFRRYAARLRANWEFPQYGRHLLRISDVQKKDGKTIAQMVKKNTLDELRVRYLIKQLVKGLISIENNAKLIPLTMNVNTVVLYNDMSVKLIMFDMIDLLVPSSKVRDFPGIDSNLIWDNMTERTYLIGAPEMFYRQSQVPLPYRGSSSTEYLPSRLLVFQLGTIMYHTAVNNEPIPASLLKNFYAGRAKLPWVDRLYSADFLKFYKGCISTKPMDRISLLDIPYKWYIMGRTGMRGMGTPPGRKVWLDLPAPAAEWSTSSSTSSRTAARSTASD